MAYIIQQVAVGAICVFAIAGGVLGLAEVVRLFLEDLRGGPARGRRGAR